jgi:hypothetical protein
VGQGTLNRPRRRTIWASVFVPFVVSLMVGAGGATAAKVPDGFFGITSVQTPTQAEFNRLKAGGIDAYRLGFGWQPIQPQENGPYFFSQFDAIVERAANARLQVLPLFYGSPPYLNARVSDPPLKNADQQRQWQNFVAAVVRRYGPSGSFWLEHPLTPYLPPTEWIIWNEINLKQYWYKSPKPGRYVQLASLARTAIRAADPQGDVVSAGLFRQPADGTGIPANEYLEKLYRVKKFRRTIDVIALHMFAETPRRMLEMAQSVRRVMNTHKDRGTPMWINELGWSSGGKGGKVFRSNRQGQARRLTQTYKLLIKNRKRLGLQRVLWLLDRDIPGSPGSWLQYMGLFDSNGNPKPAWYAFVKVAGGTP